MRHRKQGMLARRIDPVRRGRHTAPEAAAIQTAAREQTFQIRRLPRSSSPDRVLSNLQKSRPCHQIRRQSAVCRAHSKRRDLASPTDNFYCGHQKWRRGLLAGRHRPGLVAVLGSVSQEGTGETRRLEKGGKIRVRKKD